MSFNKCCVCNSGIEKISVGRAAVGGDKYQRVEESINAYKVDLVFCYCDNCNFVCYESDDMADQVLSKIYLDQHATYGLLGKHNPYLHDMAAKLMQATQKSPKCVLEIGCNDGELLEIFKNHGYEAIGVEPSCNFNDIWKSRNIRVINSFFDKSVARDLSGQKFGLIVIRHVLEHIKDPKTFLSGVVNLMGDDTLLVIESPYFLTVINQNRFDNISYPHQNHFTSKSIKSIGNYYGLRLTSFYEVDTDGGSFVAFLTKSLNESEAVTDHLDKDMLEQFIQRMNDNRDRVINLIQNYPSGSVVGYGAGAKGPHLMSLYLLDDLLNKVVDDNESFHGQYLAGTKCEIVSPEYLDSDEVKAVVNMAPTHSEKIYDKVKSINPNLDIIQII